MFREVVQMNFQIASFSSLSGTQPISWQVEYPHQGATDIATSEIFVSQRDLVGIVPLAMVSKPGGSQARLHLLTVSSCPSCRPPGGPL